ncbi:serine/threonine protein phosphatase [Allosphingosinicella flava]|uniref:Serine/threonine protein phosphatase n=1 Tax=Allosphingosinicella flava TaxID=2771430 RepID=A0A7T2LLD9_9SPHN|nr:metallophosphoesterase [Sphingosinicella flava]QPQ54415.1 serine/threonine protein phosphatase [Sphingosinicella flava]
MILKRILNGRNRRNGEYAVADGSRIYAIGDIHGRSDLLVHLLCLVEEDGRARGSKETRLIFLGDLVNRGSSTREVVNRLIEVGERHENTIFLKGNHEEVLVSAYHGDRQSARLFHRIGGRETLISYGVSPDEYDQCGLDDLIRLMIEYVPEEHVRFLDSFRNWYASGDYLFVHAGIRPGIPIELQKESDFRWIRTEFLESKLRHGYMIVHGHSISHNVDEQPNRIGIDTGAYASGKLTAMGLEGTKRWYLST